MTMTSAKALCAIAMLCVGTAFAAEEPLFSARSKAQGAPFDLTVTETSRLPAKSYLQVPGFHDRTAAGARWLMCAYTALAIERQFSYWVVAYPEEGSDRLVVGFTNNEAADAKELLGADYRPGHVLGDDGPSPVRVWVRFCGMDRPAE